MRVKGNEGNLRIMVSGQTETSSKGLECSKKMFSTVGAQSVAQG